MANEPTTAHDIITVVATSRPKRVAVLVDASAITSEELDNITQHAITHWGGGYWPIVPCNGEEIGDDWWSLLEAVDPDIVFAVCGLSSSLFDQIHRRIAPSRVVDMGRLNEARRDGVLRLSFIDAAAVEAFDLIDYFARRGEAIQPNRFLYLEDSIDQSPDRIFALRNFGLVRRTVGTETAVRDVVHDRMKIGGLWKGDLLKHLLKPPARVITPRDLSVLAAPRPFELEYENVFRGFQLIVGDSIPDALLVWNRLLVSTGHLGRDFLWLDASSARDSDFIKRVGEWMRYAFWNNQQQERGTVVSYSEDLETLTAVGQQLSAIAWLPFRALKLKPEEFPFRSRARESGVLFPSPFDQAPRRTEQIVLSDRAGLLTVPRPEFLKATSGQSEWMIDLEVDYIGEPARFSNRRDVWRLPRKAPLGHLFASSRQDARILRSHHPTISVQIREASVKLRSPIKAAVVETLLQSPPAQKAYGPGYYPATKYSDFRTSEQGRRFRAIVDLLGGVASAGRLFEDPFWRSIFLEGSGKPAQDVQRSTEVIARELSQLQENIKAALSANGEDVDIATVAHRIALSLHRARAKPATFTKANLSSKYGQIMAGTVIHVEEGSRRIRFADHAEYDLAWLLDVGALHQGVSLECPTCGTKQWRIVDDLATAMRCQHCTADFTLAPNPTWEFRVNGLIQNALADHGVLSVLHAVHDLTDRARAMAFTTAPLELRESFDGPVVTDLDVFVIADGKFIIGEVKSSTGSVTPEQLKVLGEVAIEIRPDFVIVAATGTEWPSEVSAQIAGLQSVLSQHKIAFEARLLDW